VKEATVHSLARKRAQREQQRHDLRQELARIDVLIVRHEEEQVALLVARDHLVKELFR
jgi:hypothetical protein